MKLKDLKTRIFLDGGDPEETRSLMRFLGFLDGQTTNQTLIAKNPEARKRLEVDKVVRSRFHHGVTEGTKEKSFNINNEFLRVSAPPW